MSAPKDDFVCGAVHKLKSVRCYKRVFAKCLPCKKRNVLPWQKMVKCLRKYGKEKFYFFKSLLLFSQRNILKTFCLFFIRVFHKKCTERVRNEPTPKAVCPHSEITCRDSVGRRSFLKR